MLFTIKDEHPEDVKTYLTPIFADWNDAFLAILNKRTTDSPEIEVAEWGLKAEILKVILDLLKKSSRTSQAQSPYSHFFFF
jgi:hypothetical protein